jgi:transposase
MSHERTTLSSHRDREFGTVREIAAKGAYGQPKRTLRDAGVVKAGRGDSRKELAARCNRNTSTMNRWLVRYQQGGLSAFLGTRPAPGATRKIQGEALAQLKARLAQPEGFHSYGEIQQWLEQTCQLTVAYGTLYRVVRYELKAKLKVPRPRARQQAPQKLNAFKKNCIDA